MSQVSPQGPVPAGVEQALAAAGAPENVRAERLTLEQLAALANALLGEGACKKGTKGVQ